MSHSRALTAAAVLWVLAVAGCTSGPPPPDDTPYLAAIQLDRADKDVFFHGRDSPLPAGERANFPGLVYYAVDPAYRVPARLEINTVDRATVLELPQTSTTEKRRMRRVGMLHFVLPVAGEAELTLTAFVEVEQPDVKRLFVPFTDATSNKGTYGGGRYLELNRTPTGLYDLDFNRAYHPYCVYAKGFECPLPPRENKLTTAILAGEKLK